MSRRRRGWSLIELMVAIAIFMIIVIVTAMGWMTLKASFNKNAGHDTHEKVRTAVDRMLREMRTSAAPQPQPMPMFWSGPVKASSQAVAAGLPSGTQVYTAATFTVVRPDGYLSQLTYESQSAATGTPAVAGDGGNGGEPLTGEYKLHCHELYYNWRLSTWKTEDYDVIPRGIVMFFFLPQLSVTGLAQAATTTPEPAYSPVTPHPTTTYPTSTPTPSPWAAISVGYPTPTALPVSNPTPSPTGSPNALTGTHWEHPTVYVYLRAADDDLPRYPPANGLTVGEYGLATPTTALPAGYFEISEVVALLNQNEIP